jgi:tRNA A-37 threonylcarbamoyl transferase component Bud32
MGASAEFTRSKPGAIGGFATKGGVRFGPYLLTDRIGHGGMAEVYRAKIQGHSGFEKTVVVKVLLPALLENPEFVDLFTAEAKTTAQLSHAGIVQVHDFGVFRGTPFLVMEHINGINLQQLAATLQPMSERVPVPVSIVLMTQVCHALGFAHRFRDAHGMRRQIIHGDVSPSNVMVCRDGSVKLVDFGVSRVIDEFDFDLSATLKGKFAYMAPEQVNRLPFDRRVDVFAAGIVTWELLTGQRLFASASELETLKRVDAAFVVPPSRINPAVPYALDQVVLRALARDPGDRWDSGEEMAAAFEDVARVGGGRRRVADYLASMFPRSWYVVCEVCGKQVVPGMTCAECGTDAPREMTASSEGTEPIEPPKPVAEPYAPTLPAMPAVSKRPPSITMVVEPARARPVRKQKTSGQAAAQTRSAARQVAVALGMVGLMFAIGAGAAILQRGVRSQRWGHVAASATPASNEAEPQPIGELPVPEAPPAKPLPPAPPPVVVTQLPQPAPSEPAVAAKRVEKKKRAVVRVMRSRVPAHPAPAEFPAVEIALPAPPPAPAATTASAPAPAETPTPAAPETRIRDGRLLEPFRRTK